MIDATTLPTTAPGVRYEEGQLFTITGDNLDLIPNEAVLIMNGIDLDTFVRNAYLSLVEKSRYAATFRANTTQTYSTVHTFDTLATPVTPPRTRINAEIK